MNRAALKRDLSRALSVILALCMASLTAGWVALQTPQRAYAQGTVEISRNGWIYYDGYRTMGMTNQTGSYVFCAQPELNSPAAGQYDKSELGVEFASPDNDPDGRRAAIRAICWYGFGGPGFDASLWPSTWYDGSSMDWTRYYALAHVLISDLYTVDGNRALAGCSEEFKDWCRWEVIGYDGDGQAINTTGEGRSTRWKMIDMAGNVPAGFEVYAIQTGSGTQTCVSYDAGGYVQVHKTSSNTAMSQGNGCYDLAGACYTLYDESGATVATFTTDSNGDTQTSGFLPAGNYQLAETDAARGYAVSNSYAVTVTSGNTTTVEVSDIPQSDIPSYLLQKVDAETQASLPLGSASLEGAEYTIRYYDGLYGSKDEALASGNPTRTWTFATDDNGVIKLDEEHLVSGDLYTDADGAYALPLGTYVLNETKASEGYLLDTSYYICQVTSDGQESHVVTFSPVEDSLEQVKRGDAEFSKRNGDSMEALAGIPFLLTSQTTGESHVIVTDGNGTWSSSNSYNAHSANTNGNDGAVTLNDDGTYTVNEELLDDECGTWFGVNAQGTTAPVNNSLGALPYDTYDLVELPCSANQNLQLVSTTCTVTRNGYQIDLGTLDDNQASIATQARDAADGDQKLCLGQNMQAIDRIAYKGLSAGTSYVAEGQLVCLDNDEVVAQATANFTAESAEGHVDVTFDLDCETLQPGAYAVFERVYDVDGRLVGSHEDATDTDQQLQVTEPELRTSLVNELDDSKTAVGNGTVNLVDTVAYEGLAPGSTYTIAAALVNRESGEVMKNDDGSEAVISAEFACTEENGELEVAFTLDNASLAEGVQLVATEDLYSGDALIATHSDLDNESQTVSIVMPALQTTASNKADGSKYLDPAYTASVLDQVSFTNLPSVNAAGGMATYTVIGTLMDKETGTAIQADGVDVTAQTSFTPTEYASGSVEVTFSNLDLRDVSGKSLVVYEKLYEDSDLTTPVATHEDLESVEQTVYVTDLPQTSASTSSGLPKTSDLAIPLVLTALGCLGTAAGILAHQRRQHTFLK